MSSNIAVAQYLMNRLLFTGFERKTTMEEKDTYTILVTGASGSIGRELTKQLLTNGHSVIGTYHSNPTPLNSLRQEFGDNLTTLQVDFREEEACEKSIKTELKNKKKLSALVNLAGYGGRPEFLIRGKKQRIDDLLLVNLAGHILITKYALPFLLKNKSSAVINISSISASVPSAGMTVYAAAKAGLEGFTRSVAREYGKKGLSCTCVRLGPVLTDMLQYVDAEQLAMLKQGLPKKEFMNTTSAAKIISNTLLGSIAGHFNGTVLSADSGYEMWRNG